MMLEAAEPFAWDSSAYPSYYPRIQCSSFI